MKTARFLFLFSITFISFQSYGQSVSTLVNTIDSFAVRMPVEKVYLHIDKPYYNNSDTIWLKAYILNGSLEGSVQSGLLYTELVNDTGKVVLRQSMPALLGVSWGQIALDSVLVAEGSYTLRAYTNWLQNLGEACFFRRPLYIGKADVNGWLVNAGSKTATKNGKENTEIALQLLGQDGDPVRLQDMQLKLNEGGKTRIREKMQTDMEGKLRFNFDVPLRSRRFTLIAEGRDGNGGRRVVVPLNLNREVNADMQLMPEGGSLVAGLLSKTGFKAVGEDGKGIDVNGTILDSKGKQVAAFQSTHKGIGSFVFTPVSNETYTAKVSLPKGAIKSYGLPAIKPSGMVLTVNSIPGRDSIILSVQATADIINTNSSYSLIGQSGGKVCFASTVKFKDGSPVINGRVAKSKFPSGVARFTLFNNTGEPIAERIIFIDHHDRLHIKLTTDKPKYDLNDSVNLDISVTDNDSKPVQGSFSLAVTDDSQVKTDSINVPDISSYMLLQSELKGNIEEPGYYFNDPTPETDLRLDNLLLTQGWVAYDWTRVFDKTSQPKYKAERGFEVSGSVTKASGKPIPGLKISLLSTKKPVLFMDTVSNSLGRFTFTNLQPTDTPAFLVQMKDNKTRMFEARLNVDDFTPAATAGMYVPNLIPWYVNSDTTVLNFNRQNIALQREAEKMRFPAGSNVLNEVVIKARKIIKGSKFFAGVGTEPDLVLDEKDMLKAGKLTLEDVLLKNVKGFGAKMFPCSKPVGINYMVYCCPAVIYIDGMYIGSIYTPPPSGNSVADFYGFQQSYLQNITAEDVRGIEVFTRQGIGCYTIIEVTTWSKQGVYIKRMHGRYLYRPMPVTWSKQFYKPKYTAKPDPLFDLRSTVQWQPDVVTDEQGKARLWFKLKSKKAAYTLVLQGTDLDGHTGGIRKKLSFLRNN